MHESQINDHEYYNFSAIVDRPNFSWPEGKRLAFYVAVNLESFSYDDDTGPTLNDGNHAPDVMNYSWREYGNRVGVWRFLELFDELDLPAAALINTEMYQEAPRVIEAFRKRGDEIVAHGRTNAEKPGQLDEPAEKKLIDEVTQAIAQYEGKPPTGWLAPHISHSKVTPDLLQEAGYAYLLDWAMDDQPVWMHTRQGKILSVPYSQEINDIPQIVGRNRTGQQFGDMITDGFDTLMEDARKRPVVMSVALHPYLMGQPHRVGHLKRALRTIRQRAGDAVWFTTPGAINRHFRTLADQ